MKFGDKTLDGRVGKIRTFEDGELIFDEGTISGWIFVVAYGEVEIFRTIGDKQIILDRIYEGESLGEMSFFGQYTRSAAARAVGQVGLLPFKDHYLLEEYDKLPNFFKVFLEAMAQRMRSLMEKVTILASNPEILELLDEEAKAEVIKKRD
ncbi:MAG: Crp/Fnr family transcriptional regulator [Deltaproteobacteria bacterium]|nr:Crp/Fnr family transcriptional regulator [Deltaproteobacteria bacterium]